MQGALAWSVPSISIPLGVSLFCGVLAPGPRKLGQGAKHSHRILTCMRACLCCLAVQGVPHHKVEQELSHGHPAMGVWWRHHIFGEAPSSLTFRAFSSTQLGT